MTPASGRRKEAVMGSFGLRFWPLKMMVAVAVSTCAGCEAEVSDALRSCEQGTAWQDGQTLFRDASEDWGLTSLSVLGVRINSVDFDGDGWTDLAVRRGIDTSVETQARLLRNTGAGHFEDVTESSGILVSRTGGAERPGPVWVWADVDNDGDLDVYTGLPDADAPTDEQSEVMLNNGDGTFSLSLEPIQFTGVDQPYGAAFADVDLDGNIDLWTTHYYGQGSYQPDQLYLGDGAGGFTASTSGLNTKEWFAVSAIDSAESHSVAWAAAACDLTGDGYPELLASSYGRAPNHLWLNEGGSFINHSVDSGYAYDDRMDWTDNESARCWCSLYPTDAECDGVPSPIIACQSDADAFRWDHGFDRSPYRLGGNSGATMCGDVDNDGAIDLLTTEIVHWDVGSSSDPSELLFNDGSGIFERPGNEQTGLVREHAPNWNDGDITGSLFDADNDGWMDVYIGGTDYADTRGLLYRQVAPRQFVEVPADVGIDHNRSHGSVVADFDRDGDLDMVVGHSGMRCDDDCYDTTEVRLFENLTADEGHTNFLQLDLQGTTANRAAVGARVVVRTASTSQTRVVDGGHGQWGSQDDLTLHFGLGADCVADVEVHWPVAGAQVQLLSLEAGRHTVVQPASL